MVKDVELVVAPEIAASEELVKKEIMKKIKLSEGDDFGYFINRRSIDARGRNVKVNLRITVFLGEQPLPEKGWEKKYGNVASASPVVIIGAGPAGIFAALRLIELGLKPILLERGKDVKSRRRDLAAINKDHKVNPDSNYCFGEGGAGTYSDGKLYTRSKKRGDVRRVLEILVEHGATSEILIDAHPHIGTNKLPKVVEALRNSILESGGEIHFNKRVSGFILEKDIMTGVETAEGDKIQAISVILATGHSARDIFYQLQKQGIKVESKPFAMGVRIEHPQEIIDKIQYHCDIRSEFLPASSYSLVSQVNWEGRNRGVFSFCMCPGGFIVPAATAQEEVVVNGMSPSRRDSYFANSGIVVGIEREDLAAFEQYGEFAGLEMQKAMEKNAWLAGGKTQAAPAQLMNDFVNKKFSSSLLKTSYQPGLTSANMDEVLLPGISHRLREAFKEFGKKMKGFLTNEAQIIGVESRTSSPVSVPRDRNTMEHFHIKRLFPCGEGAGYAGGIVSAAMDGEKCAEAVAAIYGAK